MHNYYLASGISVGNDPATQKRTFTGIANSGKPFDHYGERVIVDFDNIDYLDKIPVLIEHERARRAGFGVLSVINNELIITGTLLDNECGQAVATEADAGFPWQMSAHIIAGSETILKNGETAIINGQTVQAPIKILQNCRVAEVSFTPTGVDNQTSATVLSDDGKTKPSQSQPNQKENAMTLEEALAEIAKYKASEEQKDKRIKELEDENAKLKASETQAQVDTELSLAGFSKTEDGKWQGVSDTTYQILLSQPFDKAKGLIGDLKLSTQSQQQTKNAPDYLFGEQYKPKTTGSNDVQLSQNPLVRNAEVRANNSNSYI